MHESSPVWGGVSVLHHDHDGGVDCLLADGWVRVVEALDADELKHLLAGCGKDEKLKSADGGASDD